MSISRTRDGQRSSLPSKTFRLDSIFAYPNIDDRGQEIVDSIANLYISRERPDEQTLLLDGTHLMIQKGSTTACRTDLKIPLPSPLAESRLGADSGRTTVGVKEIREQLVFERCRRCSGSYEFVLKSGMGKVTIIGGIPKAGGGHYKTMSYVWGTRYDTDTPLSVSCKQCAHITRIPILNAQRFNNLMELGGAGNTIWLDALSIDQYDAQDVASTVSVMGEIYKNATCVSVLLPESDRKAYIHLSNAEIYSRLILSYSNNFILNSEHDVTDPDTGEKIKAISLICQQFLSTLLTLSKNLHQFVYWERAWTFQEWALAQDLEIAVEGGTDNEIEGGGVSSRKTCSNVKSLVLGAAMLICRYKILQFHYAEIKIGDNISRGNIPPIFSIIKALFPDEDLFLSYEEIDPKKVSFQNNFPHFGVDHLLGVRSLPPSSSGHGLNDSQKEPTTTNITTASQLASLRTDPLSRIRARLILLLAVFSSGKRLAMHDADLVSCWASMCNIKYEYNKYDTFVVALRKVKTALRAQGIVIYDFLPDTKTEARKVTTDADLFRAYAKEHSQMNSTNGAEFPGAPIFTGHADTVLHLVHSIEKVEIPTQWNKYENEVPDTFRPVSGAQIDEVISLDEDLETAMRAFSQKAIYGNVIDMPMANALFWPAHEVATLLLKKIPEYIRSTARLAIAKIPLYSYHAEEASSHSMSVPSSESHANLFLWAILPRDISVKDVIVCRESINGSLTLTAQENGSKRVIAYLTLSDHLSGTFLILTDEYGKVDLKLKISERSDMMHSGYRQLAVRELCGKVRLEM